MKLFMIVFSTLKPLEARVYSYVGKTNKSGSSHYTADGFAVVKETSNCWFLDEYPGGMPRQYRKTEEYKLVNNKNGIYMFGRDAEKLIKEWNKAAIA